MKKLFILLSLMISTQTFATGGFECNSLDGKLVMYGTTASVAGNPLIALTVLKGEEEVSYSRTQIVGYWNYGPELKLFVLDEEYMSFDYILETKEVAPRINEGVTVGTLTNKDGSTLKVECLY